MKDTKSQKPRKANERNPHWIRPTKRVSIPKHCLFFDTETKTIDSEGTQEMILAVAVYCEYSFTEVTNNPTWFQTVDPAELYRFIISHTDTKESLRVLSANIWFDLRVSTLLHYFHLAKWKCRLIYINGKIFFARFTKGKRVIEFVNIQNYFNQSVKKIGESIGIPKLKIDFDVTDIDELFTYCKRDVEIIYIAFTDYVNYIVKNKLGSIGFTLTSTAYSTYRKSFMDKWLYVHCNDEVNALERAGYYGGRCECFYLGKYTAGPYYKLDVNAMYPYVMATNLFPYKLRKYGTDLKPDVLNKISKRFSYVAHVTIQTDEPAYPYRADKKLLFPVGTFETYLTTGLLNYAHCHGHLKAIHKIAVYEQADLFKKYVDFFYGERLRYTKLNNDAFAYACKIMLNSLYGKFGQRVPELIYETETSIDDNYREMIYDIDEQCFYIKQCFYGLEQLIKMHMIETPNSIPVISAHVTDYARMYLWALCLRAEINNLYYVDTDSLIVNQAGYDNLKSYIHKTKLGMIKLEGTSEDIDIVGLKNYCFAGVHKLKGIPVKHNKLDDNVYEYQFFPGIVSELRKGSLKPYQIKTVTKRINPTYDKGSRLSSGKVVPIIIS